MPVRGGMECGASYGSGVRRGESEKVGRHLDGSGISCGGHRVSGLTLGGQTRGDHGV